MIMCKYVNSYAGYHGSLILKGIFLLLCNRTFIERRNQAGLDGTATCHIQPSRYVHRQRDAHNCGVFALKVTHCNIVYSV